MNWSKPFQRQQFTVVMVRSWTDGTQTQQDEMQNCTWQTDLDVPFLSNSQTAHMGPKPAPAH